MNRGLIFDMDGVLFLSTPAHANAFREVFSKHGVQQFQYAPYAGMKTEEVFSIVFENHGLSLPTEKLKQLVRLKRETARRILEQEAPLTERCAETLQTLCLKYRLALATSSSPENVDLFLNQSATREHFQVILSGADVMKAKPDPEIYRLAASKLGLKPTECIVVEDSLNGVKAARAASIPVIGVTGIYTAQELRASGTYLVIDRISELPLLI